MPHHLPDERNTAEALFARICRATPYEARDLAMLLTMPERIRGPRGAPSPQRAAWRAS